MYIKLPFAFPTLTPLARLIHDNLKISSYQVLFISNCFGELSRGIYLFYALYGAKGKRTIDGILIPVSRRIRSLYARHPHASDLPRAGSAFVFGYLLSVQFDVGIPTSESYACHLINC